MEHKSETTTQFTFEKPVDVDNLIARLTKSCEERSDKIKISLQKIKEAKERINKCMEDNNSDIDQLLLEHEKEMNNIHKNYEQFMITRDKEAKLFIHDKTEEELRNYLATKPIPYNAWKDADYETLADLTFKMFDC